MTRTVLILLPIISSLLSQPIRQTAWVTNDGTTPIAVLPFQSESGTISNDEPWKIIASDFDFSSKIELLRLNKVDKLLFEQRGVVLYVEGSYKVVGDSVTLQISLKDITTDEMLVGKSYTVKKDALRTVSHRFANLVLETIFLEKGPFETKILYTRRSKEGKNVYIMDYDGVGSKKISRGGVNIMPTFIDDEQFLWVYFGRGKPDIYRGNLKTGVMKL